MSGIIFLALIVGLICLAAWLGIVDERRRLEAERRERINAAVKAATESMERLTPIFTELGVSTKLLSDAFDNFARALGRAS